MPIPPELLERLTGSASVVAEFAKAEQRWDRYVDYKRIEAGLDRLEAQARERIRQAVAATRDKLRDLVARRHRGGTLDQRFLDGLEVRVAAIPAMRAFLTEAFRQGQREAADELQKAFAAYAGVSVERVRAYQTRAPRNPFLLQAQGLPPELALRWFEDQAFAWKGILDDQLQANLKAVLLNGMRMGLSLAETMEDLEEVFGPYIGDLAGLPDQEQVEPYRLETMVRTNATAAFNAGRKQQFAGALDSGFLVGEQYSAIIDTRTTEVCRFLDGKIFPAGSPWLERLSPPRHYGCRSLLSPLPRTEVTAAEAADAGITPEQAERAVALSGKGFTQEGAAFRVYQVEALKEQEEIGFGPEGKRGVWRTIGGRAVFIEVEKGESIPEAVKKAVGPEAERVGPKLAAPMQLSPNVPQTWVDSVTQNSTEGVKDAIGRLGVLAGRRVGIWHERVAAAIALNADAYQKEWTTSLRQIRNGGVVTNAAGRYNPEEKVITLYTGATYASTVVHEFGHHVHMGSGAIGPQTQQRLKDMWAARVAEVAKTLGGGKELDRIREVATRALEDQKKGKNPHFTRYDNLHLLKEMPQLRAATVYSYANPQEYFAEGFKMYFTGVTNRNMLQERDPELFQLMRALRVKKRLP